MSGWARRLSDEIPGYGLITRKLRSEESLAAGRSLMWAAVVCVCRAALVPWYMHYNGGGTPVGGPSDLDIVFSSVVLMCVFSITSMWTRFSPMSAVLISSLVFGGICARDYMTYPDIWQQGLISKPLITVLLLRGFMNALMSRIR